MFKLNIFPQKKSTNLLVNTEPIGIYNPTVQFDNQLPSSVPLNIFQTWHTLDLPPNMKKNVELLQKENPEFKYHLYSDDMCREFIQHNFGKDVLYAFDTLKPGAYKADLWRYCVLYIHGGIYLDIKYKCVNNFKLIELMKKEHWVLDLNKVGVYNALIICKPHNTILLKAIYKIVNNVKNKFYGSHCLQPTGPIMLSELFTQTEKNNFDMFHTIYQTIHKLICYNGYIILKNYNEYAMDQKNNKKLTHYSILWERHNIYN